MLHRYREALRHCIASESKAYGFTLVIWTSAALVMADRGLPGRLGALAYLGGALAAMSIVVLISFGGPEATWENRPMPRFAFGAVHVGSVVLAVLAAWLVGSLVPVHGWSFLASGFTAAMAYQLLLGAEVAFSIAGKPVPAKPATAKPAPSEPAGSR